MRQELRCEMRTGHLKMEAGHRSSSGCCLEAEERSSGLKRPHPRLCKHLQSAAAMRASCPRRAQSRGSLCPRGMPTACPSWPATLAGFAADIRAPAIHSAETVQRPPHGSLPLGAMTPQPNARPGSRTTTIVGIKVVITISSTSAEVIEIAALRYIDVGSRSLRWTCLYENSRRDRTQCCLFRTRSPSIVTEVTQLFGCERNWPRSGARNAVVSQTGWVTASNHLHPANLFPT